MKLDETYYQQGSVHKIAKTLLGKVLYTHIGNKCTAGMIVETEAYSYREKGCHAYGNLRTARTEVMFKTGGHTYVYLCYGIHNLFNIVTNKEDVAEAVLIRALEPLEGTAHMMHRVNANTPLKITSGPGKLSKAMGIDRKLNGSWLLNDKIWVEDCGIKIATNNVSAVKRVGIDYAGVDAKLPWRFIIKDNSWISRP